MSVLRYDLLCIEGIARALRMFLGKDQPPNYRLVYPPDGDNGLLNVTISPEVRISSSFLPSQSTYNHVDPKNQALLYMRNSTRCYVHRKILRVFY